MGIAEVLYRNWPIVVPDKLAHASTKERGLRLDQAAPTSSNDSPLTRTQKMRIAARYMLEHGGFAPGEQTRLAQHFGVKKQRISQIVKEEKAVIAAKRGENTN